jgi:hypothetical protein
MTAAAASAVAALAVAVWLLRRDGAFDTYRTPLFWPFLFAAGLVAVFSTTDIAGDTKGWRALVVRAAAAGGVVAGVAALIASRNPIYGLYTRDVVSLAALEAALILAAGAASELGQRYRPGTWIRTAWCAAASMAVLAIIPRLLLLLH